MSDTTSTAETGSNPSDSDSGLGDAGKKALQAERARADQAEKRLREVEASLQSASEKHEAALKELSERVTAEQAAVSQATAERDRYQVAFSKGIPSDLVDFLKGSTIEELSESADKLMAHVKESGPSTPKPDLTQGAVGKEVTGSTAEQFAEAISDRFN